MKRGILGGSFNPVHAGHVRMAVEALEQMGLDRVDLVPAATPPHKPEHGMLPFSERLRLVELAVSGVDGLGADPLEGDRPGPSFTCDTLNCMLTEQPKDELYFILGVGTFLELPSWKRGLELPGLANLVAIRRWEVGEELVAAFVKKHWPAARSVSSTGGPEAWTFPSGNVLTLLDMPRLDIKAGDIRVRWLKRRSLACLVPPAVESVLEKGGPDYEDAWGKRT